jgi:hypothetical protein
MATFGCVAQKAASTTHPYWYFSEKKFLGVIWPFLENLPLEIEA